MIAQAPATQMPAAPPPIEESLVIFDNVSRFYGETLGVNRVTLTVPPGITSLVGPNGSGKTTLMNLMTGLVRPTRGSIRVLGVATVCRRSSTACTSGRSLTRSERMM